MPDSPAARLRVSQRQLDEAEARAQRMGKGQPLDHLAKEATEQAAAERARREHEQRVARLLDEGWQQLSETRWKKDTSNARWSETSSVEVEAGTPEDASRAARYKEAELQAVAKSRES